ncbi:imelysin family protein [Celeribacter sp. PS-C1]|uniref:imelysin family protein n=1 Tax=Celeribacter sp. PS-C1 TaxID=2820813 RepID=UPI001CA5D604|nr:imelysin family protein [Celeribacter sp. PS-C1]MBW6416998.1 imelysin family protein [Celeribacter sp. PS-C1]
MRHITVPFLSLGLSLALSVPMAPAIAQTLDIPEPAPLDMALSRAVNQHTIPAVDRFDVATAFLADVTEANCLPGNVKPAYDVAFDAWMGLQHLHMGPIEKNGRILAIAFWPDKKGMIPRTLSGYIADQDPVVETPEAFADASIAVRGLFALEYMLFDDQFDGYAEDSYSCHLVQAITHDLHRMAAAIKDEWIAPDGFAQTLLMAGEAPQPLYLTKEESVQALYTMLTSSLENTKDQRIGRPIGTFDKPRPERAEARRSGRSARNVLLQLEAARDLARNLAPGEMPQTEDAFAKTIALTEGLNDPSFEGAGDPMGRLKIEIIGQNISALMGAIANEIGSPLGISAGFNASDGD